MDIDLHFMAFAALLAGFALFAFVREVSRNPAFVFTGLTAYSAVSKQISVLYLETYPTFISESGTFSFYAGASWRFLAYNLAIFGAAAATCRVLGRRDQWHGKGQPMVTMPPLSEMRFSIAIIAVVLLLQIANLALSRGLPLPGSVVTRWTYWEEAAAFPILSELFGKLMVFCPLTLGIICCAALRLRLPRERIAAWTLFIAYLAFLFLTGQRFHGFLWPYVLFGGTYVVFRLADGRPIVLSRFTAFSATGLIGLLAYGVLSMAERGISVLAGGAVAALFYRVFALQGHTYWNMDVNVASFGASWDLAALTHGMETIITTVGHPALIESYLDQEINFAAGLPAITTYVFGFLLSLPICAIYGVLLGAFAHLVLWLIRRGYVLLAFPVSYLWLWVHSAYGHASFEAIVSLKFLFFGCVTLIMIALMTSRQASGLAIGMGARTFVGRWPGQAPENR